MYNYIDCTVPDTAVRTPMVRLHTRPVYYLALLRCTLPMIFVKHESMMTMIRVHVYTAVCTCHTHTTLEHVILVPHKSMMTIPTPPVKTPPGTLPFSTVVPALLNI